MNAMMEKDDKIADLEQELNTSKRKLQTVEQAQDMVAQMIESGCLIQQADGSYTMRNQ